MEKAAIAKSRINSLTATRGIAALLIVIFHFGRNVYPFNKFEHLFNASNIAVSYFFVLSGFVMSWTYLDKNIGYGEFLKRRAVRILPFYLLAIVLSLILPFYYHLADNIPPEKEFGTKLFLNVTLMQAYFSNYVLSINPAGWSLSVEMFFYLLFPFFLKFQQKKVLVFTRIVLIIFAASQILHYCQLHGENSISEQQHNFIHYFPLFHLNEFLIGMAGATLLPMVIKKGIKIPVAIVFIVIILLLHYRMSGISLHNGMLAPLFLLLIIGISINDKGWMRNRVMIFIGEMSYAIYILQFPINGLFHFYNDRYFHLSQTASFYTYLGVLFLATIIAHYTIEKPLRKIIMGLGKG